MKAKATRTLLVIVILACCGCATLRPGSSQQHAPERASENDYRAAFTAWSREGRIYDGLDVRLISAATYLSPQFRAAFAAEYARRYQLTALEQAKFLKDQQNAGAAYEDFVFAAYVPEKNWDDFYKKDSIWKIYITVNDSKQVKPVEIRKLDKRDAKTGYFYTYVTPWKSIYRLRFPKVLPHTPEKSRDTPDSLTLVITSVLGSVEMEWDLKP